MKADLRFELCRSNRKVLDYRRPIYLSHPPTPWIFTRSRPLHTRHGSLGPAGHGSTRPHPHAAPLRSSGQAKRNMCACRGSWVPQGAHRHARALTITWALLGPLLFHDSDPDGPHGPHLTTDSDKPCVASLIRIIDLRVHTPGWSLTCGRNHPS